MSTVLQVELEICKTLAQGKIMLSDAERLLNKTLRMFMPSIDDIEGIVEELIKLKGDQ